MSITKYLFLFLLSSSLTLKSDERSFVILHARQEGGMFSVFTDVLSLAHHYETQQIAGFEIDFGTEGLYHDLNHGSNWWNYFLNLSL